eukprot:TRINITY_DN8477_c0_g2_i1.p1 TRINITY_DN8477_c0_g2~~TRINITY_DN8477_c0_g2_i1.p1  ORF type:complete len:187 (+),score=82.38 TRINITY_DN8477_c0_g2_i1:26-562(+)
MQEISKKRGKKDFIGGEKEEEMDEDAEREFSLLMIDISVRKAVEEYEACKEEMAMLEQVIRMKEKSGGKLPPAPEKPPKFQNFVLLPSPKTKEQIKKEIFRPSYPLPTMTVEEWAEQQMDMGLLPAPGTTQQQQQVEKEDTEEEADRETLKARAWDDWKDDNPKGDGNKNDNYFRRGF